MKCVLVVCVVALAAVVYARNPIMADQTVIKDRRELTRHRDCLLDKGKCDKDGETLKSNIKAAFVTYCDKCTAVQCNKVCWAFGHIIKHEKDYWKQIWEKYDPKRKFAQRYEDAVLKQKL